MTLAPGADRYRRAVRVNVQVAKFNLLTLNGGLA